MDILSFSPYGGISTNKCRRNDGLENHHLANATVGIVSSRNHAWVLQLVGKKYTKKQGIYILKQFLHKALITNTGEGRRHAGGPGRRCPGRTVRIHINNARETDVVRPLV